MSSGSLPFVLTSHALPYYAHTVSANAPLSPEAEVPPPMFYGVTGFRIPSLAVLPTGYTQTPETLVQQVLYRFQRYVRELHLPDSRRSFALQLMAHPRATYGSQVGMYVLCRSAEETPVLAQATAQRAGEHAFSHFPSEGLFAYGSPVWLKKEELRIALFMPDAVPQADVVELRKYQERQVWDPTHTQFLHYLPHRFWPDLQMDPWVVLIENLSKATQAVAIRIELIPTRIGEANGLDDYATAARWFGLIDEDITRMASKPDVEIQDAKTGQYREEGLRVETKAAVSSAARIAYVKRGKHVFNRLMENADQLFAVRVLIAAEGEVPENLVQSVRTALSSPAPDTKDVAMGWIRPDVVRPKATLADRGPALRQLNWMAQTRWARDEKEDQWYGPDLRFLATADEASSLFHLPIAEKAGKTSALSTSETPFIIPPEVLDGGRFGENEPLIKAGYLYQRETLLNPGNVGDEAQAFRLPLKRLMMPSLLVGAPGSGKSNMALYMLVQLWRDHKMPFLVLDPSTGLEYRLLLGSNLDPTKEKPEDHESTLSEDFVVFTVGDNEGCPLRFNPFAVPPGVTVRSHVTRLMAAFKSAYSMPDPFPAVFESAMQRLYTSGKYVGEGNAWSLDEKGGSRNAFPSLADFSVAMNDELDENVLPSYKGSGEATGILKGGTTIRIESLFKNLGHILNVKDSDPDFWQRVLRRPCVVELGALGDSTSIALIMAFLLTQLVGHVEHAFSVMRDEEGKERLHLMLIEEAHRLLSGEGGDSARGKSAEDLSVMLAEVRKFGQGIMTLDQRPSSLVGGVLDNANIKILTRLSDRHGFERLAMELNMNEDQQRHARTRLNPGDAVMMDWKSGQPVLIRSANVSDGLRAGRLNRNEELRQMLANAEKWGVVSPPAVAFQLSKPGAAAAKSGEKPAAADKSTLKARDWMTRELEDAAPQLDALLTKARGDSILYHHSKDKLKETNGDIEAALGIVSTQMDQLQGEYVTLMVGLWEKMKLAALGLVVEEHEARGDLSGITEKLKVRRKGAAPSATQQPPTAARNGSGPNVKGDGTVATSPTSASGAAKPTVAE